MRLADTNDRYLGRGEGTDWVVDRESLIDAARDLNELDALIVVIHFPEGPWSRGLYSGENAPYFTLEAMEWFDQVLGPTGHLLTNLPSVDREDCGGHTPNHRVFWGLGEGERAFENATKGQRLLTELLDGAACPVDGKYVLDLHVSPFDTDAAPSRPILYRYK